MATVTSNPYTMTITSNVSVSASLDSDSVTVESAIPTVLEEGSSSDPEIGTLSWCFINVGSYVSITYVHMGSSSSSPAYQMSVYLPQWGEGDVGKTVTTVIDGTTVVGTITVSSSSSSTFYGVQSVYISRELFESVYNKVSSQTAVSVTITVS